MSGRTWALIPARWSASGTPSVSQINRTVFTNDANFRLPSAANHAKPHQIATFADLCNDCGNCEAFCPDLGAPNRVKLRMRIDEDIDDPRIRAAVHDPSRVNFINAMELEES